MRLAPRICDEAVSKCKLILTIKSKLIHAVISRKKEPSFLPFLNYLFYSTYLDGDSSVNEWIIRDYTNTNSGDKILL